MDHQAFAQLLGNYGEFLGAIAIVVTLVYLAAQIKQSTKVARSSTRQATAESMQGLTKDFLENREMAEIFVRHLRGEDLDAVDRLRMEGRCYRDMHVWEDIYYQLRERLLLSEEWSGFRKNLAALFAVDDFRTCWQAESSLYGEDFSVRSKFDPQRDPGR